MNTDKSDDRDREISQRKDELQKIRDQQATLEQANAPKHQDNDLDNSDYS